MKLIKIHSKIHSNLYTKVSDCDYGYLNQFKWYIVKKHNYSYACRNFYSKGRTVKILMTREILKPDFNMLTDHINHDTLDNQRENLRICTHSENMINRKMQKNNTSGVTGIRFVEKHGKWLAGICVNKKRMSLGRFVCPLLAMLKRQEAELKYFGEFAFNRGQPFLFP